MWAWPTAVISCVRVPLRRASSACEDRAVARVAEAVELAQELALPGAVGLVHQRREHAEVAGERPRLGVEDRELAALEPEGGRDRRRPLLRRVQLGPAEQPVAGDLDARAQRLAGRRARGEHRVGPVVLGARHEALDRLAVEPQRRLRVGHQQQVDLLARPLVRHGRLDLEPPRRPQRAELHAERGVALLAVRAGDPHPVGRAWLPVHERLREPRRLADTLAGVVGMGRHRGHAARP